MRNRGVIPLSKNQVNVFKDEGVKLGDRRQDRKRFLERCKHERSVGLLVSLLTFIYKGYVKRSFREVIILTLYLKIKKVDRSSVKNLISVCVILSVIRSICFVRLDLHRIPAVDRVFNKTDQSCIKNFSKLNFTRFYFLCLL